MSWPRFLRKVDNIRFIITSLESSQPSFIYETVYCGRGQMENFIKDHKFALKSGRTSRHSFMANSFRLMLHSAAYVILHTLRGKALIGTEFAKFRQVFRVGKYYRLKTLNPDWTNTKEYIRVEEVKIFIMNPKNWTQK